MIDNIHLQVSQQCSMLRVCSYPAEANRDIPSFLDLEAISSLFIALRIFRQTKDSISPFHPPRWARGEHGPLKTRGLIVHVFKLEEDIAMLEVEGPWGEDVSLLGHGLETVLADEEFDGTELACSTVVAVSPGVECDGYEADVGVAVG